MQALRRADEDGGAPFLREFREIYSELIEMGCPPEDTFVIAIETGAKMHAQVVGEPIDRESEEDEEDSLASV